MSLTNRHDAAYAPREKRLPVALRKRSRRSDVMQFPSAPVAKVSAETPIPLSVRGLVATVVLICGIWSYWPTLQSLASIWSRVADYSHGFVILPLALYFLWIRRESCPKLTKSAPLTALGLLGLSLAIRHAGDAFFFNFMDGWSILPWVAGLAAILGGWPFLLWCLPSIVFLIFMVPLPFSIENDLSGPLQRLATVISTTVLQALGQPAFAEGNIILIGEQRLEVARACSGLRLFTGVLALTYAYVAVVRRAWWEKAVLIAAAIPVAIASNAARIVGTGLLYQLNATESARGWIHDAAGWGMIVFAGLLFWALLWYLRRLFVEEDVMDISAVVKQCNV